MMKIGYRPAAALGAMISMMAWSPASAQHDSHQAPGAPVSASPAAVFSCAQNSQAVSRSIDAATPRIEEARQSNDTAKMRAAVADLQIMLAQVKTQLAECMALSQGNAAMPGVAIMDHSRMNMPPATPVVQPSPAAAASAAVDPHAGHTMTTMPAAKPVVPAKKVAPKPATRRPAGPAEHAGHDMSNMPGMKKPVVAQEAQKPAADPGQPVITLQPQPPQPRAGENQFEVTVKDKNGQMISDADVSLEFFMPAAPASKMPEMRSTATLSAAGNGVYRGKASIGMAGQWDATVVVTRGGQRLGSKQTILTVR